jgi:hypothetical protein
VRKRSFFALSSRRRLNRLKEVIVFLLDFGSAVKMLIIIS